MVFDTQMLLPWLLDTCKSLKVSKNLKDLHVHFCSLSLAELLYIRIKANRGHVLQAGKMVSLVIRLYNFMIYIAIMYTVKAISKISILTIMPELGSKPRTFECELNALPLSYGYVLFCCKKIKVFKVNLQRLGDFRLLSKKDYPSVLYFIRIM